ncbi:MAG: NERD domain protein [Leifsonia sp.]|nr:NERD domain protein [Leifsonia sp.]
MASAGRSSLCGMTWDRDFAGASAHREHARLRREREASADAAPESIQDLLRDAGRRSRDVRAWEKGAAGESIVGRTLTELADHGVRVLHDRRVPGGTSNLDHLAIAPTGVYVIDAKNYAGRPRVETFGAGEATTKRLFIGRDDRHHLVQSVQWQTRVVEAVLADATVPVRGILCFIGADWEVLNGYLVEGVGVTSPERLADLLRLPGPLDAARAEVLHRHLLTSLDAA